MAFSLKSLLPARFQPVDSTLKSPEQWLVEALLGGLKTSSGVTVTPLKALGVSTVYACVNRIAGTVSSIPLKLMRTAPNGDRTEARDHPLYSLMHDAPNPEMTSTVFRRTMQTNLSLHNAAYAFVTRNGMGEIVELTPIPPCDITVTRDDVTKKLVYTVEGKPVKPEKVLRLLGMTGNGICPIDMTATMRDTIGLAIALQENAGKFFSNGSRPGATLEHPGKLKPETLKRIREEFEKKYKGSANAYSIAILEEGMKLTFQRQNNNDSQFEESRKRQALEICQYYGIPPHKVGILDNATFSNIEEQNIEYVTDAVQNQVSEWEQAMNQQLLTEVERKTLGFRFVLQGLVRGSITTRYAAYAVARNWGWLSINEIRHLEDMNGIGPEGDKYNTPPNSATTSEPSKPAAPTAPTPTKKE